MLLDQRRRAAAGARRQRAARIAVIGPNADRAEALQGCYSFANHVLERLPRVPGRDRDPHGARGAARPRSRRGAPTGAGRWRRAAASRATTAPASRRPSRLRAAPTSRSSWSATRPGSSAAAPSARATTPRRWTCPACSASWSRPWWPPGRRWCWCCSPGGRTPSAGRWTGRTRARRRCSRRSSPARAAGSAIADVLTGAVNPSGPAPGHPAPLRRCAAVLLPAADPRRPVRGDVDRPDAAASLRFRAVVHHLRLHRPGRGRQRRGGRHLPRGRHRDQHRRRWPVPTSCSCTAATSSARWCVRWPSCSATRGSNSPPGECRRITFEVPTTRLAFSDRRLVRIVEPGEVEVWVASHAGASADGAAQRERDQRRDLELRRSAWRPRCAGTATARACLQITGRGARGVHARPPAGRRAHGPG